MELGIASLARGIGDRDGPKAAVEFLSRTDPTAFDDPSHAEVAEVWIENLAASGRASEAVAKIEAGARRHPESARLQALRGDALRLAGADRERVRAAYQKALELDPKDARALRGLAGLEAEQGANDAALALYDRALAADPDSLAAMRAAANVLVAAGRGGEAEERLAALLRDHPYDAEAALALATQYAARDAEPARTRELARRAVRFGGGPKAKAFLEKVRADQKADQKPDEKRSAPAAPAAPAAPSTPAAPAATKRG